MKTTQKIQQSAIRIVLAIYLLAHLSCRKVDSWLDIKPNKSDATPSTLRDYQALLDNDVTMNSFYPFLGQVLSDDYYSTTAAWQGEFIVSRNAYVWEPDIFAGNSSTDWTLPYTMISYANICLDGLKKIDRTESSRVMWDNIYGSAYFYRGLAYYYLLQEFTAPYDAATAETMLGLPLRTSPDVNLTAPRSTLKEAWAQVIADLTTSEKILSPSPGYLTRPSATAARAMLARVYLSMSDYTSAKLWADKVLEQPHSLLDFNTLNATPTYPLPTYQAGNKEVLFYAIGAISQLHIVNGIIDSTLYRSYAANDLRRSLYFRLTGNTVNFRGQYSGVIYPFHGIAMNELYLIRAEVNARSGQVSAAMADLNTLLVRRWKTGTFTPLTAATPQEALGKILEERRKELLFYANTRWDDLRRLNREPAFAKSIIRVINNQTITIAPGDKRYALLIPDNEIRVSGIQQNPR